MQQGNTLFECQRVNACRMADGDAFGMTVIECQIQQDQVAQPVFVSPLAGHAPVAQGQHGITDPQQTLAVALDDLDALFMQACEQAFSDTEVAFHSTNLDFRIAADFSGVRALRALGVAVETLAALASQTSAVHQFFLDQRRQEARVLVVSVKHRAGYGVVDVMADQIRQLERAHGETASLAHQRIQCRAVGRAFLQHPQALGVERPGHAVDDETRRRTGVHRFFAPGLGRVIQALGQGRVAGQAGDDFHQCHHRRRVEEVQAEQALWMIKLCGDAGDR
ncbi:hypothetical protein D3C85_1061820 [compost metagenome]